MSLVPHIKQEDSGGSGLAFTARTGGRSRPRGFGSQGSSSGLGGLGIVDGKGYRWCNPLKKGCCHWCRHQGHQAYRCIYDMPSHIKDSIMGNHFPSSHCSTALATAAAFVLDLPSSSPPHARAGSAFTSHCATPASVSFGDFDGFDHFPQDSGSEDEKYTEEVIPYEGGLGLLHI